MVRSTCVPNSLSIRQLPAHRPRAPAVALVCAAHALPLATSSLLAGASARTAEARPCARCHECWARFRDWNTGRPPLLEPQARLLRAWRPRHTGSGCSIEHVAHGAGPRDGHAGILDAGYSLGQPGPMGPAAPRFSCTCRPPPFPNSMRRLEALSRDPMWVVLVTWGGTRTPTRCPVGAAWRGVLSPGRVARALALPRHRGSSRTRRTSAQTCARIRPLRADRVWRGRFPQPYESLQVPAEETIIGR